ncbi:hypothetical protein WICPIJ_004516 [Wickerhamomyces pijperi]|uniref:Uncharacterized protein n=1 Tax=Wickerhamomyces pijperi TaxID=599730 RepID=A0A9P8Q7M0_WICPI|nr:hypothetical protein WICPIJ_004516 [Wickerhamomyces pijperi]
MLPEEASSEFNFDSFRVGFLRFNLETAVELFIVQLSELRRRRRRRRGTVRIVRASDPKIRGTSVNQDNDLLVVGADLQGDRVESALVFKRHLDSVVFTFNQIKDRIN